MKCLMKYQWVKLPRSQMPAGKGVMGAWARLASRAAFRNGQARYCNYINRVTIGSWAGGIVGLKSILGIKKRNKALELMDKLAQLGYINYELDSKQRSSPVRLRTGWSSVLASHVWVLRPSMPPKGMGSYAYPGTLPSVSRRRTITLMRRTHGWISGATQYGGTPVMRFLIWRQLSSLASMAPF